MQSSEDNSVTKARILIVEDERPLILLVRRTLLKQGYEVVGEVTVEAGLRRIGEERFDLVLVDYRLPDKTGVELISELAARSIHLPVIMLTGYTDVKLAVDVMKAGAADYVIKDARLEFIRTLPKKISEVLDRHLLERRNEELLVELEKGRLALEEAEESAQSRRQVLVGRLEKEVRKPFAELLDQLEAAGSVPDHLCQEGRRALLSLEAILAPAG